MCGLVTFMVDTAAALAKNIIQVPQVQGTADIFRGFMVSLYVKGKENSYYVCNRKPGDGLIAPLRSIVFFRIEKRDEPLRYASRTLASLNAMKGGSGKKKVKSWHGNNWIVFLQMKEQYTKTIKTVPICKGTKFLSKDKRFL